MKLSKLMRPMTVQIEEAEKPACPPDKVLLRINRIGVCASDMQVYHGLHKYAAMPVRLGHEIGATVEEVGAAVKEDFKPGQKVAVQPQMTCTHRYPVEPEKWCWPCRMGRINVCEHLHVIGIHEDGAAGEYYVALPSMLHHVPQETPNDLVALAEPLAVAVGSATRSPRMKGGNVVVVGAGTVGNLIAQAAKNLGAEKVMITDILQDKLDYAHDECGIDFAVNTKEHVLKDAIVEHFGIRKADVIIDACAIPAVFDTILDAARPCSDIVVTGNYKKSCDIFLPVIQRQEISLLGHMMYTSENFEDAIRLLSEGKINTDKIITQRIPFNMYAEGLNFLHEHPEQVMKMIITISD